MRLNQNCFILKFQLVRQRKKKKKKKNKLFVILIIIYKKCYIAVPASFITGTIYALTYKVVASAVPAAGL